MKFHRALLLFLAVAFATCLALPSARAQDAASAFDDGLVKWKAGEFDAALPLFEQALVSSGSPNARFYVARCLRDLGRLPEAYEAMSRTVKDARKLAENEERYAQTRDAAAAELVVLEGKIGRVIVALDETLANAYVTLNGATLPKEKIGVPVAVMPGLIEVVAQNPDGTRVARGAEVVGGETATITVSTAATTAPPPTSTPTPEQPEEPSTPWFSVMRGVGIAVAAVGVAGIVVFAIQNGVADDRFATLESECGNAPCPDEPRYADLVSEGETAQTIAGIGLGVGIAGILAGTAMLIFGAPDDAETSALQLAPHPGGVALRAAF